MQTRLIDATSVQAIARCVSGAATHTDDVDTFVRFCAALLATDRFVYMTQEDGGVRATTGDAVEAIEAAAGASLFKRFGYPMIGYSNIFDSCRDDITAVMTLFLRARVPDEGGASSPNFQAEFSNPDAKPTGVGPAPRSTRPSNLLKCLLTAPRFAAAVERASLSEQEMIRVGSAARTLMYRAIAQTLKVPYWPAASRLRMLLAVQESRVPTAGEILNKNDSGNAAPVFQVFRVLLSADANPGSLMRRCVEIRNELAKYRRFYTFMGTVDPLLTPAAFSNRPSAVHAVVEEAIATRNCLQTLLARVDMRATWGVPNLYLTKEQLMAWIYGRRVRKSIAKFYALVPEAADDAAALLPGIRQLRLACGACDEA